MAFSFVYEVFLIKETDFVLIFDNHNSTLLQEPNGVERVIFPKMDMN